MKSIRSGLVVALVAALSLMTPTPASAADTVTVAGQTRTLNGTNIYRSTDYLVLYTPAKGATTGTNQYGFEAEVIGGKVTKVQDGVGNMAIPSQRRRALRPRHEPHLAPHVRHDRRERHAAGRDTPATPTDRRHPAAPGRGHPDPPELHDRQHRRQEAAEVPGGHRQHRRRPPGGPGHPVVLDVDGLVGKQIIFKTDGTKDQIQTSLQFYYAGDGHNHFHMRDFDAYEIFNPSGMKLRDGEKHGFCFEDNTGYRDWPGRVSGSPANPVYTHATSCGEAQPSTTSIVHGLSKGWGDTYPTTLPDQAIDITGLADGTYQVKVTADRGGWWIRERTRATTRAYRSQDHRRQ